MSKSDKVKIDPMCDPHSAREILDEPVCGIQIWCMVCGNEQTFYMSQYDNEDPINIEPVYCTKCKRERRFRTAGDK